MSELWASIVIIVLVVFIIAISIFLGTWLGKRKIKTYAAYIIKLQNDKDYFKC